MSSTLHSLYENLTAAGIIYGWRLDAVVISGLLWTVALGARQLRTAS